MFTNKDIEVFDNKIDDLEDSAEVLTDKVNEGLIKNQKAIISIIESYIKEHQLIVYGGNAQNLAIKKIERIIKANEIIIVYLLYFFIYISIFRHFNCNKHKKIKYPYKFLIITFYTVRVLRKQKHKNKKKRFRWR